MNYFLLFFLSLLFIGSNPAQAQTVDGIFFHLYTDSLKKGTYNYINVDGKMSNGRWMPLTTQQIDFASSAGKFEGNNLVLDKNFNGDSVVVTALLKSNQTIKKTIAIYIKKKEDNEPLKTAEEIMKEMGTPKRRH